MPTPVFSPFVTYTADQGTAAQDILRATLLVDIDAILALFPNSNGDSLGTPGTPGSGVMPDVDAVRPEFETLMRQELEAFRAAIVAAA